MRRWSREETQCLIGQTVNQLLLVFTQATGNFFTLFIGHSYQTKLFPEGTHLNELLDCLHMTLGQSRRLNMLMYFNPLVFVCLLAAMAVSALVHRVSATTW